MSWPMFQRARRLPLPPEDKAVLKELALYADPEFLAARRAVYQILYETFAREGERPPADFFPDWPYSERKRAQRSRDPELRTWSKECQPEAERIMHWMTEKPGFNPYHWVRERRPEFLPATKHLVTVMQAVAERVRSKG